MAEPGIRVIQIEGPDLAEPRLAEVEAIFFEASGRTFEPGPAREAFRERWLGRYLLGGTDAVFLAITADGTVAGYLVGALENPAEQPRFADIDCFRTDFAGLCRQFPAHLHINLAPAYRSQGIGARLIDAFAAHAAAAGASGMHVTTAKDARNVVFYERCGFVQQGSAIWNGRPTVFLGRALITPADRPS
jgi:GNAT superfamily N-acetyltransferase